MKTQKVKKDFAESQKWQFRIVMAALYKTLHTVGYRRKLLAL